MLDSEKPFVKSMLDTLADMLHVTRLEDWQKDEYFQTLKKYPQETFIGGIKKLQENYEPKRLSDFPVLAVMCRSLDSARPVFFQGGEALPKQPGNSQCSCCHVIYKSGLERPCDCGGGGHCYRCDKCHNHCPCPPEQRLSYADMGTWAVAEYNRIMAGQGKQAELGREVIKQISKQTGV